MLALSILHLLEDKEKVIASVYGALRPGGVFVSSTMCLGDNMKYLKPILAIGRLFRLLPVVKFLRRNDLENSLTAAGFHVDQTWQPGKGAAVFIVARKPDRC